MTIKNVNTISELQQQIHERTDKVEALNDIIVEIRNQYKFMTDPELTDALLQVADIRHEIAQHKRYCIWAKDQINRFYTPSSIVA